MKASLVLCTRNRAAQFDAAGAAYVAGLLDGMPRIVNVEAWSRIIKEKAALRNLIHASNRIVQAAYEAEDDPANILDQAEKGEEIVITRSGRPVAKLVPAATSFDPEKVRGAIQRIRALADEMSRDPFDWEEWKRYRDEGRP